MYFYINIFYIIYISYYIFIYKYILERERDTADFLPSGENMPMKSLTSQSSKGLLETRQHEPRRMNSLV